MQELVELASLLALMLIGYGAARGHRAIGREVAAGFLGWSAIFAVLIALVRTPPVLVWVLRIGLCAAVVYGVSGLGRWVVHEVSGVPAVPPVRRRHVLRLCRGFGAAGRGTARRAAREALRHAAPAEVFCALVAARLRGSAPEAMAACLAEEARRAAEMNEQFVQRLRVVCASARRLDAPLVAALHARFGEAAVRAGLADLERRNHPDRRHLPALVRAAARDVALLRLVAEAGLEAPPAEVSGSPRGGALARVLSWAEAVEVLSGIALPLAVAGVFLLPANRALLLGAAALVYLLITLVLPLSAYVLVRHAWRAVLFGLSYVALLAYAALLLRGRHGAMWVFLAVVALLHFSALMHLRTACGGSCPEDRASGDARARS